MVNKAILIGRLGKDPEVQYTPNGNAVAKFSIATSEKWVGKDGQSKEVTDWHNIVVWNKQGENCGQYLAKGSLVYIEGKIRTRKYDDKNGVTRYVTEIIADRVKFLDHKKDSSGGSQGTGESGGGAPSIDDDDIPF